MVVGSVNVFISSERNRDGNGQDLVVPMQNLGIAKGGLAPNTVMHVTCTQANLPRTWTKVHEYNNKFMIRVIDTSKDEGAANRLVYVADVYIPERDYASEILTNQILLTPELTLLREMWRQITAAMNTAGVPGHLGVPTTHTGTAPDISVKPVLNVDFGIDPSSGRGWMVHEFSYDASKANRAVEIIFPVSYGDAYLLLGGRRSLFIPSVNSNGVSGWKTNLTYDTTNALITLQSVSYYPIRTSTDNFVYLQAHTQAHTLATDSYVSAVVDTQQARTISSAILAKIPVQNTISNFNPEMEKYSMTLSIPTIVNMRLSLRDWRGRPLPSVREPELSSTIGLIDYAYVFSNPIKYEPGTKDIFQNTLGDRYFECVLNMAVTSNHYEIPPSLKEHTSIRYDSPNIQTNSILTNHKRGRTYLGLQPG